MEYLNVGAVNIFSYFLFIIIIIITA